MTETPAVDHSITETVPAHHPLLLMHNVVAEPIDSTIARLSALGSHEPEIPLHQALRAALLQAYYGIDDFEQLADHLRFNLLFRWFVGSGQENFFWDTALYAQLLRRLNNEQELTQFFNLVTTAARAKEQAVYAHIAATLDHWVNTYCPRSIYFQHYSKSPLKEVLFTIEALSDDIRHPTFPPHIFYEHVKHAFPVKEEIGEVIGIEVPEFRTKDGNYRLATEWGKVFLLSRAHYETWEETLRPYVVDAVNASKATYNQAQIARVMLLFSNVIKLPAQVELTDYFHMLPAPPPKVIPPRIMREQNLSYSFPKMLLRANYETDLIYEDGPRWLGCTHKIRPAETGLEVNLELEAYWSPPPPQTCSLDQVLEIADQLKQDIYVAFHSLITDRTRELFE